MTINNGMLFGALVGYEQSNTDSNNGGDTDSDGYILSAYVGLPLSAGFTAYADLGYSSMDTDIKDRTIFSESIYGAGLFSKGSYDTDTYFLGFGVMRSSRVFENTIMTMDLGYHYGESNPDSYIDNFNQKIDPDSTTLSLANFDIELAQPASWGEYYGSIGTQLDLSSNIENTDEGDFALNLGVGIRFNASENFMGEVGIIKEYLTKGHRDYTVSANMRYSF